MNRTGVDRVLIRHVVSRRLLTILITVHAVGVAKQHAPERIELEAGSAHVLRHESIKQVAVGNSQLVQANAVSSHEVVLFAKQPGKTTVDIWTKQKLHRTYQVVITQSGFEQRLSQVKAVVSSLRGVTARQSGQHILIEGTDVSTDDKRRLKALFHRFPDLVDLTSPVAWDQMVLLDVKVLELPSHLLNDLGVRWQSSSNGGFYGAAIGSAGTAGMMFDDAGPVQTLGRGASFGVNEVLKARLKTMLKQGEAVLLAQPQLMARSGSAASFLAGGEVPYAFVDRDGKRTTLFKKHGVLLNVTPHVGRKGSIRAKVDVEVSDIDPTIVTEAGPAMRVRKTSTEFNVKSGQTLVLSGFVSRQKVRSREGWVGSVEKRDRQVELAIFVTPTIVSADHPDLMARVAHAQRIEAVNLGSERQLNLNVNSMPDATNHRWDPSHPTLSQWGNRQ